LSIPAVLAVSTLALPLACGDDGSNDDTGSASMSASGTDSGATPDCLAIGDEPTCSTEDGCVWNVDEGLCVVECAAINDEQTCSAADECYWDNGECFFGLI
jgi:hypothetical protein